MKSFVLLLLISFSSFGVTNSRLKETYKAVVKLESHRKAVCTGTVVGLNPPTVLTAKHCVDMRAIRFEGSDPETVLTNDFDGQFFSTAQAYLPGDLAILIFAFSTESKFRKLMNEKDLFEISFPKLSSWQKVRFCGFGGTSPSMKEIGNFGTQICGENYLLKEDSSESFHNEANNVFLVSKVNTFSELTPHLKAKYSYSLVQAFIWAYGKGSRYGMAALNKEGKYGTFDKEASLIREGDSGGPLFIIDENGKKILIAVTSGNLRREENLLGAFFWRLDHPWSKELMNNAFNQGGDIRPN